MTQKCTSESCRQWLASVLRGEGCTDLPASVDRVVELAMEEGVAVLLLAALGAAPIVTADADRTLTSRLSAVALDQLAVEMIRKAESIRVVTALLGAGIPFMMLKGASLAYRVYEQPHQRPRCDLDLLLPSDECVSSAGPLLQSLGYEGKGAVIGTLMTNEVQWRRRAPGGTVQRVDAHWALTNNQLFGARFHYGELERDSVWVPGFEHQVRGLGDVHALIHACLHRVANMPFKRGDRLIWLYDVLLLAKRLSPSDWERLGDLAVARGIAGPVIGGLDAAIRWLACPEPPEGVSQRMRSAAEGEKFDLRRAHRRGYLEWHSFLATPARLRARWVWQKLFPSAAYLQDWSESGGPARASDYWRRLRNITRLFRS